VAGEIERRRAAVRLYRERLDNAVFDDVEGSAHFAFAVLFDSVQTRIRVREALAEARIQTTRYPALQKLTEFARYDTGLPNAEQAAERHLALPLSAHTTVEQVERVTQVIAASA
jgi:dTDP-4-amino-4,6-dideoxygalactose transaminase